MKALTVRQPWAWAIMHGGKTIENRTQNWKYRGPLAIHSSIAYSEEGGKSPLVAKAIRDAGTFDGFPPGVILGLVDLVDAHKAENGCCAPWGEQPSVGTHGQKRQAIIHLVLENPRSLRNPIKVAGALGLWTPPPSAIAKLEAL